MTLSSRKRQRGSSSRLSALAEQRFELGRGDEEEFKYPPRKIPIISKSGGFNDAITADVILSLHCVMPTYENGDEETYEEDHQHSVVHLHSDVLKNAGYFSALLSGRWEIAEKPSEKKQQICLNVPFPRSVESYHMILQLLYTKDYPSVISDVPCALALTPIASELLYDECLDYCLRFLEAVPWTEDQEQEIIALIPHLKREEAVELLARILPMKGNSIEDMLNGLIYTATHCHSNGAAVKAFVAKLLRDYSSRDAVRQVLDNAFTASLKTVQDSLEEYSSPNLREDHDEIEAIQRMNLHKASMNAKHLLWLIERMIELKVADNAVKEWSEQQSFAANLHRTFRDDAWRNIVPGLPVLVLRCTCRLASAVASGNILASRQVRMKLVKDWLPVLIVCRDNALPNPTSPRVLIQEMEDVFLQIISTLRMPDAQVLLQQCLGFTTRNMDDCSHLVTAFDTWFRRAGHLPNGPNLFTDE